MDRQSVIRISNILNLTRQEYSVIEKHIFHSVLDSLKNEQGFNIDLTSELPLKVTLETAEILKKSKNKDALKAALKSITSRNFSFDFSTNEKEEFGSITPIYYAKYESVPQSSSSVTIKIAPECKKLFLDLAEGYTNIVLNAVLSLKSEYSIRMYELMSMYKGQSTWTVPLDKLRGLLNVEKQYIDFKDFRKRILEYSQKELWEHCNLHFEWEIAEKKGKKITALTFHIKERDKQERAELSEEIKYTQEFIKSLSPGDISQKANFVKEKYNLTRQQFDYILSNNEVFNEFIRIDLIIEDMIAKGKPPRDRTKYLAKSLKLDKVKFPKAKPPKLFD